MLPLHTAVPETLSGPGNNFSGGLALHAAEKDCLLVRWWGAKCYDSSIFPCLGQTVTAHGVRGDADLRMCTTQDLEIRYVLKPKIKPHIFTSSKADLFVLYNAIKSFP